MVERGERGVGCSVSRFSSASRFLLNNSPIMKKIFYFEDFSREDCQISILTMLLCGERLREKSESRYCYSESVS